MASDPNCMPRCRTCRHWKPVDRVAYGSGDGYEPGFFDGGHCRHPRVGEERGYEANSASSNYNSEGAGLHWTGPDFGCVHHESRSRCDHDVHSERSTMLHRAGPIGEGWPAGVTSMCPICGHSRRDP